MSGLEEIMEEAVGGEEGCVTEDEGEDCEGDPDDDDDDSETMLERGVVVCQEGDNVYVGLG